MRLPRRRAFVRIALALVVLVAVKITALRIPTLVILAGRSPMHDAAAADVAAHLIRSGR